MRQSSWLHCDTPIRYFLSSWQEKSVIRQRHSVIRIIVPIDFALYVDRIPYYVIC